MSSLGGRPGNAAQFIDGLHDAGFLAHHRSRNVQIDEVPEDMKHGLLILFMAGLLGSAKAEVKSRLFEYKQDGALLEGFFSFDDAIEGKRPAVLVVHQWKGLALHGADDPFVPPKEVQAFEEEMRQRGVDWQLVAYGGAVHAFTDWNAGNDNAKGAAYNEKADKRSWEAMKQFFSSELFR